MPNNNERVALVGFDKDFVNESCDRINIFGYFSLSDKKNKFTYLGCHENIGNLPNDMRIIIVFDDVDLRSELFEKHKEWVYTYISPLAFLSNDLIVGAGSIIMANSYVSSNVSIGNMTKISVGVQIHHDVQLQDYNIIAPRVTILGCASIGSKNFIGAGTLIKNGTSIGDNNIVGMGSNVIENVGSNIKLFGNPARTYKKLV